LSALIAAPKTTPMILMGCIFETIVIFMPLPVNFYLDPTSVCWIISIIDAYYAMTNARPYHKAISEKRAIKELKRCSGTQFDPSLVGDFVEFIEQAQ
jgi:hypothetical protein